jgi:hypothetical protein
MMAEERERAPRLETDLGRGFRFECDRGHGGQLYETGDSAETCVKIGVWGLELQ